MTVFVIGNATFDRSVVVDRLPEAGETRLARGRVVDAGGKGLNQAVVAQRAGAKVVYCAPIGDDHEADVIRACLDAEGMRLDGLVVQPGATDESLIWVTDAGENAIVSTAERAWGLAPEAAAATLDRAGRGDVLLMQGNLSRDTTRACLERARGRDVTTVLNPAPIHFDYAGLWPLVDVAVVNRVEARLLGGEAGVEAAGRALRAAGAGAVVVTLGADGVWWIDAAGQRREHAPKVEAIDTTGAGDVFCGVLAAALTAGYELRALMPAAVAAATAATTRRGTSSAFPSAAEIAALLPRRATAAP